MAISDLPIFSMLRTRMNWHQERQRLLAANVANADTPNYRPRDLAPLNFAREVQQVSGQLQLALTSPAHLSGPTATGAFATERQSKYDIRPAESHERFSRVSRVTINILVRSKLLRKILLIGSARDRA